MKIKRVGDYDIWFDNGASISYDHVPEDIEENYADFSRMDEEALTAVFSDTKLLVFKEDPIRYGFLFGNPPNDMYFVPCYSRGGNVDNCRLDVLYFRRDMAQADVVLEGVLCEI